jgi:DNA-binding NarL/FixJ family response regulator
VIRVLIVDDHAVVRRGLTNLLDAAEGITVVGAVEDGSLAAAAVLSLEPDIVLMDLSMPTVDGIAGTRAVLEARPATKVIVLTSFSEGARILAALEAGAVGYLLKDADPEDVLDGVRAVSRGESPIHPRAARQLLTARADAPVPGQLTAREAEVLKLVRAGLANKQIARRLGISDRTVKAHLTSVFQRIGVVDRTQAALWAERNGL